MQKLFGYSYIEILVTVGIIAIIGVMVTPVMSSFFASNQLRLTEDALVSMVRKSQSYAMSNKNNTTWGICLSGNDIRLYSGSCLTPTTKENHAIPKSIEISGLSDFQFSKGNGELTSTKLITLSTRVDSVLIEISPVGGIVVN